MHSAGLSFSPPPCGEVGERSDPGGGPRSNTVPHPKNLRSAQICSTSPQGGGKRDWTSRLILILTTMLVMMIVPTVAFAADAAAAGAASSSLSINLTGNGLFTDRIVQIVALMT